MRYLHSILAENFLSLQKVEVALGELSVLVGPNASGKTNLLRTVQFLGDMARLDLAPAIAALGGFEQVRFRGGAAASAGWVTLGIRAQVTTHSSLRAPDEYRLSFLERLVREARVLVRRESFKFKRTGGQGRRITVSGSRAQISDESARGEPRRQSLPMASTASALATLPRLGPQQGAEQVGQLAALFQTFRVFDPDVRKARMPSAVPETPELLADASNLAAFLVWLSRNHEEVFELLEDDLRYVVPGLGSIHFVPVGGATEGVSIQLGESGLRGRTPLAAASFGTVRGLALLAMLHDPNPPKLTCVEELDHGLHPYALDRMVERLRGATRRTQLLVATHSPALVNRLEPHELIVCERDAKTGASRIPAIDPQTVRKMAAQDDLRLGELWFSGALGGVL